MTEHLLRPELVIFDFDGVLADSEVIALGELRTLLEEHGASLSLDEVTERFLGTSIAVPQAYLEEVTGRSFEGAFADIWHKRLFDRFAVELSAMRGADQLLDRCSVADIPVCIASGGAPKRLDYALRCIGLADRLGGAAFSADLVGKSKPEPDLFLFAARQFGAAPDRCIVIEDAPSGIRAARAAGMTSLGFVGGSHIAGNKIRWAQLLKDEGAARIFERLDDIADEIAVPALAEPD